MARQYCLTSAQIAILATTANSARLQTSRGRRRSGAPPPTPPTHPPPTSPWRMGKAIRSTRTRIRNRPKTGRRQANFRTSRTFPDFRFLRYKIRLAIYVEDCFAIEPAASAQSALERIPQLSPLLGVKLSPAGEARWHDLRLQITRRVGPITTRKCYFANF